MERVNGLVAKVLLLISIASAAAPIPAYAPEFTVDGGANELQLSEMVDYGPNWYKTPEQAEPEKQATPTKKKERFPFIPGETQTYIVQDGDTLERIAREEFGVFWYGYVLEQNLNTIKDPDKIRKGMLLFFTYQKGQRKYEPKLPQETQKIGGGFEISG